MAPLGFVFGTTVINEEDIPDIHLPLNIKISQEYISADMAVMRMEDDRNVWYIYNYTNSPMKFLEFDKNMKLTGKWIDNGNDVLVRM